MTPGETIIGLDLGNHRWIVLSLPTDDGEIALANLTEHGRGPTCGEACTIVRVGEHPFITKESCVYYRGAYMNLLAPLLVSRDQGTLRQHDPVSNALLERIQRGALSHRQVSHAVKKAIQASL